MVLLAGVDLKLVFTDGKAETEAEAEKLALLDRLGFPGSVFLRVKRRLKGLREALGGIDIVSSKVSMGRDLKWFDDIEGKKWWLMRFQPRGGCAYMHTACRGGGAWRSRQIGLLLNE